VSWAWDDTPGSMIGLFDSGMGGLSILLEIRRLLPSADLVYLADQGNAPYGDKTLDDVRRLAEQCTSHLLAAGADIVVVACNTASAAALHHLRALHPGVPFVGMEPAIKPAAAITRGGVIGVLATAATFQGELFGSLIGRFGGNVQIVAKACRGWADLVERAELTGPRAEGLIADHLDPVLAAGADTLVLGCTHYPFLRSLISDRAGPQVAIVDPAPAVARQVALIHNGRSGTDQMSRLEVQTTANPSYARRLVSDLTGIDQTVTPVTWPRTND
jgi:glutamate racemase